MAKSGFRLALTNTTLHAHRQDHFFFYQTPLHSNKITANSLIFNDLKIILKLTKNQADTDVE